MKDQEKIMQIVLISVIANLLLNYFITKSMDPLSSVIYFFLTFALIKVFNIRKMKSKNYLLFGIIISLVYNVGFMMLGFFTVSYLNIIYAALQQGVLTLFTAKLIGGSK
jgi:O-antigen/teichoic acid export membrane protein